MRAFDPVQLQDWLQQASARTLLLDVREPWEYEICHIPGSQLVPMRQIADKANQFDTESDIVVICHHGIRSRQVALYLESLYIQSGIYTDVNASKLINLEGGLQAWAEQVDRSMATY